MNLGDVAKKTVPKMCLVSPPRQGGAISTRTFIPHRVHESIGVLGAVSVATACVTAGIGRRDVAKVERRRSGSGSKSSIRPGSSPSRWKSRSTGDGVEVRRVSAAAHGAQADARRGVRARSACGGAHERSLQRLSASDSAKSARRSRRTCCARRIRVSWRGTFCFRWRTARRVARAAATACASSGERRGCRRERGLVISAVTAAQDVAAARSVVHALGRGAFFLDLNSVSPGVEESRSRQIVEAAGGRYVEAAVMSPIAPKRIGVADAARRSACRGISAASRASSGSRRAKCSPDCIGRASAAKMCRSVIVKGMEALLAESLLAARRYGVEERGARLAAESVSGRRLAQRSRAT